MSLGSVLDAARDVKAAITASKAMMNDLFGSSWNHDRVMEVAKMIMDLNNAKLRRKGEDEPSDSRPAEEGRKTVMYRLSMHTIPAWVDYMAVNKDGSVWGHHTRPVFVEGEGFWASTGYQAVELGAIDMPANELECVHVAHHSLRKV